MPGQTTPEKAESGVLALSRGFTVMSLNRRAKTLLGCDPMPGSPWPPDKLFSGDDLDQVRAAVAQVLESGRSEDFRRGMVLNGAGRTIACEYSIHPLYERDRKIIGVIFNFHNLPPSPEAPVNGMPPGRLDYRTLVDDLPEAVFTIDAFWRVTAFNRTAQSITGYSRQEAIGRRCWEIFRSDLCHKNCPMRVTIDSEQVQVDQEVSILTRNGERQALRVNVSVLRNPAGKVIGAVETFRPAAIAAPAARVKTRHFCDMTGNSPAMRALFAVLPDIAASEANVLICGESGTGKELVAQALHNLSNHRHGPFVAVNCAALAENLLESELFGHEKGAFTGADRSRPGRFELAGDGTLFLDEIGELKPDLQVKLLRALEQRAFERVGGTAPIAFRARVISATNQDLMQALKDKRMREDLYYRLRTVPVNLPPLAERREDIPMLVEHFIKKLNAKTGKSVRSVDPKVIRHFMAYHWPGNVRELERCIEHAFVFVKGPVIFERHLPAPREFRPVETIAAPESAFRRPDPADKESLVRALKQAKGRRAEAAVLLGISRTSMWRRMKAFDLL